MSGYRQLDHSGDDSSFPRLQKKIDRSIDRVDRSKIQL